MSEVRLIDSKNLEFNVRGDSPGMAYVARELTSDISPNMGIGFARWKGAEVEWQVLYDKVVFVIEGRFDLTANGQKYEVRPRQMLWIPEGTELIYGGHALFGYVVHPGNWKETHGLA
ncbi:hypothetical protein Psyaliredsea_24350 [Psychrobacter alimentarius]